MPATGQTTEPVGTRSIEGLGEGSVELDGPWQFHLGDDAKFALPGTDDRTGHDGWEQIRADAPWGAQGHPAYEGYGWYRRHLHLTLSQDAAPDVSMLMRLVEDAYEVYWNGALVASYGHMPPHPSFPYQGASQTFGLGPIRDGVLAIRVWKSPLMSFQGAEIGGIYFPPVIGSSAAIAGRKAQLDYVWIRSRQYFFALTSLYALVMILSLLAWLRDRSQRVLLWMAVFCFSFVGGAVLTGLRIPIPFGFALGVQQPVLSLQDIGLWFLLLWILKLNESAAITHLTRTLAIIGLVVTSLDGAISMLDWSAPWVSGWVQVADAVCTAIFTTSEIYPLVLVVLALRKRLDSTRWLVAIAAFTTEMISVTRIALQQGSRFTHWTLGNTISSPIFFVNGNAFTVQQIADTLLFLAILYAAYRYTREASLRQGTLEQEFRSARELQQVLIPEALPTLPGYEVSSAYRPAQEVGGDFFQIVPLEGTYAGSTLVVLGDVSGKGLRAAMAVSLIVGMIRAMAENIAGPAQLLTELNRRLFGRLQGGFVTCVALLFDSEGICLVASAGHPPPFLNGRELSFSGSLPLGLIGQAQYEESCLRLRTGDHLALYTDGLLEAKSVAGDLYGFERLQTLFAARPNAADASGAAVAFGQDDDITVLTLVRLGSGQESTTTITLPDFARRSGSVAVNIPVS